MRRNNLIKFRLICPLLIAALLCPNVSRATMQVCLQRNEAYGASNEINSNEASDDINNNEASNEINGNVALDEINCNVASEARLQGERKDADLDEAVSGAAIQGISAKAYALYEVSSEEFLYEKNAELRMPMASTTKIMTALTVADACGMDEVVVIGPEAVGIEGSSAFLRDGDSYTVRELLYALLLQSANDAAVALACYAGGGIDEFSAMMNEKANDIGLESTHFTNPHGLDDDEHFTTARELAIMGAELLKNEELGAIARTYKKTFTYGERTRTYINHNKLLLRCDGCIGIKTGYTRRSGRCLVGAALRDGVALICVTLDAPSDWSDQEKLFECGFNTVERVTLCQRGDHAYSINVIGGSCDRIRVSAKEDLAITKKNVESAKIKYIELPRYIIAPVKVTDTVGRIVWQVGDKEYSVDIAAEDGVEAVRSDGGLGGLIKRIFGR